MELNRDQYETYVKEATPVHRSGKNVLLAFLAGGALCTAAQALSRRPPSPGDMKTLSRGRFFGYVSGGCSPVKHACSPQKTLPLNSAALRQSSA